MFTGIPPNLNGDGDESAQVTSGFGRIGFGRGDHLVGKDDGRAIA
jgi:hypothetical protein